MNKQSEGSQGITQSDEANVIVVSFDQVYHCDSKLKCATFMTLSVIPVIPMLEP